MCHHVPRPPAPAASAVEGVIEHASPLFLGVRAADGSYRLITAGPLEPPADACLDRAGSDQPARWATAPS